jgi:hypothetical protein
MQNSAVNKLLLLQLISGWQQVEVMLEINEGDWFRECHTGFEIADAVLSRPGAGIK